MKMPKDKKKKEEHKHNGKERSTKKAVLSDGTIITTGVKLPCTWRDKKQRK